MSLDSLADALAGAADALRPPEGGLALPNRAAVLGAVERLRSAFFPGYFEDLPPGPDAARAFVRAELARAFEALRDPLRRAIAWSQGHPFERCPHCAAAALEAERALIEALPAIRRLVASDVEAAFDGDPALHSRDEAILSYPGIYATVSQRIAHALHGAGVPLLPRIISEGVHDVTGIDIHPGAELGERFFIDHGTGVVIGETTRIGRNVRLYQGVTLGAKSFPVDELGRAAKGRPRHPILEDDVTVYAGATILGRVTIGRGSVIGGNVWLTTSVAPQSRVTQAAPEESPFAQGGGI